MTELYHRWHQHPMHPITHWGIFLTLSLVLTFTLLSTIENFYGETPVARAANYWESIIDPSRAIDWTHAGVPGGIPNRTTRCATLDPGATATQINAAIAACPEGQVVHLNAGTYNVSSGINLGNKKGITLRGAGAGQTILNGHIYSGDYGFAGNLDIVSGYEKGSTNVVLSDTNPQISVGNLIRLSQADDGELVLSSSGSGRRLAFISIVTAVNGNAVTFSPALPYGFSEHLEPRVSYLNGGPGLQWTGIEDMTVNYAGSSDVIRFFGSYACWVKGVELTGLANTGVFLVNSSRCEVRDSHIHDAVNFPANPDGYGVYLYYSTSYSLVVNNVFYRIGAGVLQSGSGANAVLYNYSTNITFQSWAYQTGAYNSNHGAHPMMVLWEGNVGAQYQDDGYHGNSSHQTLFRNWFSGIDPQSNGGNRKMISIERGGYYHNVIGNILGDGSWLDYPGLAYEMAGNPGYTQAAVIYRLGYPNMANNSYGAANPWPYDLTYPDAKVKDTLMRWGNFDYITNSTRWLESEVPTGVNVPSSQNLPPSFYYSSKPSWFGNVAWPPIGPDVTGGNNDTGGYVHKIPAQICFEQGHMPDCLINPPSEPEESNGNGEEEEETSTSTPPVTPPPTPPSPPSGGGSGGGGVGGSSSSGGGGGVTTPAPTTPTTPTTTSTSTPEGDIESLRVSLMLQIIALLQQLIQALLAAGG